MPKNSWHDVNPTEEQELLAWYLVSKTDVSFGGNAGLNPYGGAKRLGAGNGADDYWLDTVQTSSIPAVWEYRDTNGNNVPVLISRSALVPYVVKDAKDKDSLDHLLVGYVPQGGTAAGAGSWGTPPTGNARPLRQLGYLITQDLNPAGTTAQYVANWYASVVQDPVTYARPRRWSFRRMEYNVEKSVRIPSAWNSQSADILIGFVGGGAI